MNLLFICNQNKNRSKTAEELFHSHFNTKSAGLYNQKPVTQKQLAWADIIFVMEDEQRSELAKRFPQLYIQKRILSLNIPDVYSHNEPPLIKALQTNMEQFLPIMNC